MCDGICPQVKACVLLFGKENHIGPESLYLGGPLNEKIWYLPIIEIVIIQYLLSLYHRGDLFFHRLCYRYIKYRSQKCQDSTTQHEYWCRIGLCIDGAALYTTFSVYAV